jgi:hypothetical protein
MPALVQPQHHLPVAPSPQRGDQARLARGRLGLPSQRQENAAPVAGIRSRAGDFRQALPDLPEQQAKHEVMHAIAYAAANHTKWFWAGVYG